MVLNSSSDGKKYKKFTEPVPKTRWSYQSGESMLKSDGNSSKIKSNNQQWLHR